MVEIQLLRLLRSLELAHLLHERPIAVDQRYEGLLTRSPFQILPVSPTPFPGIVHVQHGLHVAFAQLDQESVEAYQQRVVVNARRYLERRLHTRIHTIGAIAAHQDTEVFNTQTFQGVELMLQAVQVPTTAFRGQDGSIPEVGTDKGVGFSVTDEMAVLDGDESVSVLGAAGGGQGQDAHGKGFEHRFHGFLVNINLYPWTDMQI